MKALNTILISLLLTACASPNKPLQGNTNAVKPENHQHSPSLGSQIRWAGFVIKVENTSTVNAGNKQELGCLTILAKTTDELSSDLFKNQLDTNRFIACKSAFLEPQSFMNKSVRITGTITRLHKHATDEVEHLYPVVDIQMVSML